MKGKLKIIAATFIATTVFWCLAIVGIYFCLGHKLNVGFIHYDTEGFADMIRAQNTESRPVMFTVAEMPTNGLSSAKPIAVLLERELPPHDEFWIGIKQTKSGGK